MSDTQRRHDETSLRRQAEHLERLVATRTRELARLSAFPEENANPIVEIESTRAITYLNPAARSAFPELPSAGFAHPVLRGLGPVIAELERTEKRFLVREVAIGERVYEQHISAARSGPLLRIYMNEITARKRAHDALRRYGERQRVVLDINNAIVANLDQASFLAALGQALGGALCFDRAALTLVSPTAGEPMVHALAAGPDRPVPSVVAVERPDERSRHLWVLEHRRPIRVGDLREEPAPEIRPVDGEVRSTIVAPLLARGGALGTITVACATPHRYSEEDAEFLTEVGTQLALAVENMRAYEEVARLTARFEQENLYLREEVKTQHNFEDIVGQSDVMRSTLKEVETVAPTDATVLLTGETGTGKEIIARAVHRLSRRCRRRMVVVNCAALPAGLIESELFGHEKGAFTGAVSRKIGRFELADGGTLLLDEVGALPMDLQAKLLRALQGGQFERVGGTETLTVDVRVISATNADLAAAMERGRFREDLYYRLSVFPIHLPPLRDRTDDIPLLVRYLVMRHAAKLGRRIESIPQAAMRALQAYRWPGNIRELENVIERAIILSRGSRLELRKWQVRPRETPPGEEAMTLEAVETRHIRRVLDRTGWRVSGERGAAKVLGLKPTTLEARMKRLGIRRPERSESRVGRADPDPTPQLG